MWYRDKFTGTAMDRPGLDKLLADARGGKITRVCVWRLDRLGRTAKGLLTLLDELQGLNVGFVSLREGFDPATPAGRLMADLMAGALMSAPRPDALVPVPLHARRIRQRGYDQALELARPLAAALALPLRADLLQRIRATAAQSELDAGQRQRNLARAFAVADQAALPAHVALVDDVMTTGATLAAAAHALRTAGVERVDAWVCARVP